jgi:phosphoribosylanthranilate isomerase
MTRIKVCGVTSHDDAAMCIAAGVDAIGLNFWPHSVRRCEIDVAEAIAKSFGARVRIVAVFVDAPEQQMIAIRDLLGERIYLQLHGDEPPGLCARLGPRAYKALRVGGSIDRAGEYGGDEILFDTMSESGPGGTGRAFDWKLAAPIARERKVWLAGGITPENAGAAIDAVHPFGVDVASGVESAPGKKDIERVTALVRAVREAR